MVWAIPLGAGWWKRSPNVTTSGFLGALMAVSMTAYVTSSNEPWYRHVGLQQDAAVWYDGLGAWP